MLIGIDASRAISPEPTGTETYSRRLINALLELDTRHTFRLYFRTRPEPGDFVAAERKVIRVPRLWTHVGLSWEMATHPPDALFVPAHVLPLVHVPASVVTIHDLGYLEVPQAHPWRQRLYLDRSTRWSAARAAHLLADSLRTKNDLARRYGVRLSKITVAHPGVDDSLTRVHDRARVESLLARLGATGPYFLYLGTLQPRKNLSRLLDAFAALDASSIDPPPTLVIAGRHGWLSSSLEEKATRLGLDGRVFFPGYVEEGDKATLLSGALAFVFPSLYEGFGMPVVEAQRCGCPVITSTASSLPEVAGKGALLVDPRDTTALRDAMWRTARDSALRATLIADGHTNARRYSWGACAVTVLRAIERGASALGVIR
jgi:glycosyltransferase involved in cell wall biosynthesis